jgi:uncharacterized protein YcgL (UPF0745 family)
MEYQILSNVEKQVAEYKSSHKGEVPLYILVPSDELETLTDEVKSKHNYPQDMVLTTLNGSKIIKNESLKPGEVLLTNDLPETSS